MSCIYKRGNTLWLAYKDATGKRVCRPSGFRIGQEAEARALLAELERQLDAAPTVDLAAIPTALVSTASDVATRPGDLGPTVLRYGEAWIEGRRKRVASVSDEEGHLRNHVFPRLGHMLMRDIKPRHIRDFVLALSEALVRRRGKDGSKLSAIAPRTVRHVFATLHRMFRSAVIDEVILTNPVVVERGVLPKNIDKDPEWRATAVFDRGEVVRLISDAQLPHVHRILHALKGLAALRHGEAAGLRWCDYHPAIEPLGKLVIARSYTKERTKTQITRVVPVHPVLARLLVEWERSGWEQTFGRPPQPTDLIVPHHDLGVWPAHDADDVFKSDLETLDLRGRRGHDLRRTFITLAQIDGARRDLLKVITHGPASGDIINLYTTFPWPALCAEVAKLAIALPAEPAPQAAPQRAIEVVDLSESQDQIEGVNDDAVALHVALHVAPDNPTISAPCGRSAHSPMGYETVALPLSYTGVVEGSVR